MAYYPEFAIGYSSSSGEGGAKLYRHIFGEQMANLAGPALYHWMGGNFLRYGGPLTPGDLPVDNHELIALCAPRPCLSAGGSSVGDGYAEPGGDAWADSKGMFLAEVAAGPVYELLGRRAWALTEYSCRWKRLADQWRPRFPGSTREDTLRLRTGRHFSSLRSRYLHAPVAASRSSSKPSTLDIL